MDGSIFAAGAGGWGLGVGGLEAQLEEGAEVMSSMSDNSYPFSVCDIILEAVSGSFGRGWQVTDY